MGFSSRADNFAPSKRVVALAIGIVALIAAVILVRQPNTGTSPGVIFPDKNPREASTELDSDGDGLKDWEEELWGLNPYNPDTHGTGLGDLAYVEQERARVAEVPTTILGIYDANTASGERPSSSALAGQILISQLFASKEAGIAIPDSSIRLASEIALSDFETNYSYTLYTAGNILTASGDTIPTIRAYGNAVGQALKTPSGQEAPHELSVLLSYAQTSNTASFKEQMDAVLANYDRSIANLLNVPAPPSFVSLHTSLINSLVRVRTDLSFMGSVDTNPILALAALDTYEKNSAYMAQLFEELRKRIAQSGITYESHEAGALIMMTSN